MRGIEFQNKIILLFIQNIYSFPSSQLWKINKNLEVKKLTYWKLEYKPEFEMSYEEAKNKTQDLIENSIKIRSSRCKCWN